jgi:hypothetical protein
LTKSDFDGTSGKSRGLLNSVSASYRFTGTLDSLKHVFGAEANPKIRRRFIAVHNGSIDNTT